MFYEYTSKRMIYLLKQFRVCNDGKRNKSERKNKNIYSDDLQDEKHYVKWKVDLLYYTLPS
jgi:hypothetical protein